MTTSSRSPQPWPNHIFAFGYGCELSLAKAVAYFTRPLYRLITPLNVLSWLSDPIRYITYLSLTSIHGYKPLLDKAIPRLTLNVNVSTSTLPYDLSLGTSCPGYFY